MLNNEDPFKKLKNEMDARIIDERYKKIIGSIVYFKPQRHLNDEISTSNLESIDLGPQTQHKPENKVFKKKESLLDALTLIINNDTIKCESRRSELKINVDYLSENHNDIDLDYEKNLYFSSYKECSPIKRNLSENKKRYFKEYETEETWL